MNIGSLTPPANPITQKESLRNDIAVAGSKTDKDKDPQNPRQYASAQHNEEERREGRNQKEKGPHNKRKGRDRRQRNLKPLVDMRASRRDRRNDPKKPIIHISV